MLLGAAGDPGQQPEPPGFRNDDYRSQVPATLHGAIVLTTEEAHAKSGKITPRCLSMFCLNRRSPPDCRRRRSGDRRSAGTFREVCGYRTLDTAHSRRSWRSISNKVCGGQLATIENARSCSIVWRIAGCRGMPQSARSRWATLMSPGIRMAPMGGPRRACRSRPARPSRGREPRNDVRAVRFGSCGPARTNAVRSCRALHRHSSTTAGGPGRPPHPM